jgi:hypothetical protein
MLMLKDGKEFIISEIYNCPECGGDIKLLDYSYNNKKNKNYFIFTHTNKNLFKCSMRGKLIRIEESKVLNNYV